MQKLIRTTITLPEDLLQEAKIQAVKEKTTLSGLIRQKLTKINIPSKKESIPSRDPMTLLGKYKIGIKSTLRREEMYEEHLKHKIPRR